MRELSISVKFNIDERVIAQEFEDFRRTSLNNSRNILADTIHQELVNRNLIVEGHLDESWTYELTRIGDKDSLVATSSDIAANVLEYGAEPADGGIVSFKEILNWATKKGITPERGTIEQYAFAIAKKIGKEGQPLHGGLKRPLNAAQKKANRKIERQYGEDVANLVKRLNNG
jgi:hypothetical protein